MILWGRSSSANVQKILWCLDELGLSFDHKIVGGKYGGTDTAEFAALTPVARVPVMQDGDITLWESNVILRYLGRKMQALGHDNPHVDMWMEFGSTTLQPPFIGMFWQRIRMTPDQRDECTLEKHMSGLSAALDVLESTLAYGRMHIAGDDFSLADISLGTLFFRIRDLNPKLLEDREHLAKWHDRIAQRAAYKYHIATSYDELKVIP